MHDHEEVSLNVFARQSEPVTQVETSGADFDAQVRIKTENILAKTEFWQAQYTGFFTNVPENIQKMKQVFANHQKNGQKTDDQAIMGAVGQIAETACDLHYDLDGGPHLRSKHTNDFYEVLRRYRNTSLDINNADKNKNNQNQVSGENYLKELETFQERIDNADNPLSDPLRYY